LSAPHRHEREGKKKGKKACARAQPVCTESDSGTRKMNNPFIKTPHLSFPGKKEKKRGVPPESKRKREKGKRGSSRILLCRREERKEGGRKRKNSFYLPFMPGREYGEKMKASAGKLDPSFLPCCSLYGKGDKGKIKENARKFFLFIPR